eukprot:scaffold33457_cov90-Isochrysis_galbana.AAC.7
MTITVPSPGAGRAAARSTTGARPVARSVQPRSEWAGRTRRSSGGGEAMSSAASMEMLHFPASSGPDRDEVVVYGSRSSSSEPDPSTSTNTRQEPR